MNRPFIISVNIFYIIGDLVSKIKETLNKDGIFIREIRNSITVYQDESIVSIARNFSFCGRKISC
jgi:hypothetical protein